MYVDDIICVSHEPEKWMKLLPSIYRLSDVGVPTKFLVSNIKCWTYVDGQGQLGQCWALGSETYVKEACAVVDGQMKAYNLSYPSTRRYGANSPFSYSTFSDYELTNVFQNIV